MHPWCKPAFLALFVLLQMLAACSKPIPQPAPTPVPRPAQTVAAQPDRPVEQPAMVKQDGLAAPATTPATDGQEECRECQSVDPVNDRAECFKLQPGKTSKNSKGKTVTGRCQPQCVPYARCRSGIMTCRLGDTSPVEWFECARKNKATTSIPKAGSIMVIGANTRRKMPTGHLGYVEEACPNADGTWTLRFSHTNYDRKCHLDLDAEVLFNPKTMTATFLTGAWKAWAKDLKISGFILR